MKFPRGRGGVIAVLVILVILMAAGVLGALLLGGIPLDVSLAYSGMTLGFGLLMIVFVNAASKRALRQDEHFLRDPF